jgi:putative oxidoreductase
MKKPISIDFICYAIILLFLYAALSKLFLYNIYVYDLHRSPFIGKYASYLSLSIPTVEIVLSVMLFFERTRLMALWGSFILMILFTGYVALILGSGVHLPCTCGGLIRNLSWRQHLAFNIFYTGLAGIGIWIQKNLIVSWQRN